MMRHECVLGVVRAMYIDVCAGYESVYMLVGHVHVGVGCVI